MAERPPTDVPSDDWFGEGDDTPLLGDVSDRLAVAAAWLVLLGVLALAVVVGWRHG